MNIYLIGFMGSGKSTVGKILSEKLKMEFVDIDKEIEKQEKTTIKQIFKEKGEKHFRELERKKLEEFLSKNNFIVSTGGGLGANLENIKKMKESGVVVWLDVSLDEVLKRCANDEDRPLLKMPVKDLQDLYEERKNVYKLANIHIKAEKKSPEKIAEEIIENIRRN
jgi:shikimate kinase